MRSATSIYIYIHLHVNAQPVCLTVCQSACLSVCLLLFLIVLCIHNVYMYVCMHVYARMHTPHMCSASYVFVYDNNHGALQANQRPLLREASCTNSEGPGYFSIKREQSKNKVVSQRCCSMSIACCDPTYEIQTMTARQPANLMPKSKVLC